MTGPFDSVFPAAEYPPGEWFDGPPAWVGAYREAQGLGPDREVAPDGETILKMTVTDDGRVGGWFFEHGQCLVSRAGACPKPSPTGYAAFHQNDVVTEDGSMILAGVIGNTHGHASPWVTWRDAQRTYADPSAQMIVCRAGDDDRGGWVAGALVPGLTYGDVALLRRCSLSGDWRPDFPPSWWKANGVTAAQVADADGYDCVGPTLVTRPGLPLTAGGQRGLVVAASLASLDSALDGPDSSTLPTPAGYERTVRVGGVVIEEAEMGHRITLPDGVVIESTGQVVAPEAVTAAVIGEADLPLGARDASWDGPAAEGRVRALASSDGSGDPDTMDWASYSRAFFYRDDAADPESFGAYKLGFADVADGQLQAVPAGLFAVAGVLQGARGGADIPQDAQDQIRGRVDAYYAAMREAFDDDEITVPWDAAVETAAVLDEEEPMEPETETAPAAPTVEDIGAHVEGMEIRLAAVEEFLAQMLEQQVASVIAADVAFPTVEELIEAEPAGSTT